MIFFLVLSKVKILMLDKIAIIGSRDLSHRSFFELVDLVKKELNLDEHTTGDKTLISGGSSWADFIAVFLKSMYPHLSLELYLPSNFSRKGFESTVGDNGAAKTLNMLHEEFYNKTGINSIKLMYDVSLMDNVVYNVIPGFLPRNDAIALNCDVVIALSQGKDTPDSRGTSYTWNKCKSKKRIHISV